jgi:site-specific DNA recombinase
MMTAIAGRSARGGDVLAEWAQSLTGQTAGRHRGRLRFVFYGRVSTEDWQDPVTSRARQLQQPAVRRYLLAGLLACGQCGRRLESAWSNGKPAYRCRHGHTSATSPDPARRSNTYVREDQILPHLAAIGILVAGTARTPGRGTRGAAQLTRPADTAALIDQLRAQSVELTYDPDDRTLHLNGQGSPSVTIGKYH